MKLPGNMQQMMQQAQQMQEKMQQEIALIRWKPAGGGMVTVKMDGQKNLLGVKIDPEVAGDVEMLQDMVVAACNEAVKKVDEECRRRWAACSAAWVCRQGCFRRDARFRRTTGAPDRRIQAAARRRTKVRAEDRVPHAARAAATMPNNWRRRSWT